MLMERFAEPEPLEPRCTTRGGVFPLSLGPWLLGGELRRTTLRPGTLLGVSSPAVPALVDRLKRGASAARSSFAGDVSTPASANNAWVTLENLMAGGGSSSESLSSPMSMRFIIGASAEKPLSANPDKGELRRIGGRATAAIMRLTVPLTRLLPEYVSLKGAIPKVVPRSSCRGSECGGSGRWLLFHADSIAAGVVVAVVGADVVVVVLLEGLRSISAIS